VISLYRLGGAVPSTYLRSGALEYGYALTVHQAQGLTTTRLYRSTVDLPPISPYRRNIRGRTVTAFKQVQRVVMSGPARPAVPSGSAILVYRSSA
jgi:hypothetical protein